MEQQTALQVETVKPGSPAAELGIQPGDIVRAYNNAPIASNTALSNAMFTATEKKLTQVPLVLGRGSKKLRLTVPTESLGIQCTETVIRDQSPRSSDRMTDPNTNYGVARSVATVISLLGWALVALGALVAIAAVFGGLNSRYGAVTLVAVLPGLGTVVSGFLLIMGSQVTKATVDTADHTRAILQIAKDSS